MINPHIVICCATDRGLTFVKHVRAKMPDVKLTVFTFRENQDEPPFLDNITKFCEANNIRWFEAKKIEELETFWAFEWVDVLFAVGWRYLIPKWVYETAKLGAYVFHDSLLPKYRGFAPTVRALMNAEPCIGTSLIRMVEEVDRGDILCQTEYWIGLRELTIAEVMPQITQLYLNMFDITISSILDGRGIDYDYGAKQIEQNATYSPKMTEADYVIDWNKSTEEILRLIRATTKPYPGARTKYTQLPITVWAANRFDRKYIMQIPGRVVEKINGNYVVMTRDGAVYLTETSNLCGIPLLHKTLGK